MKFVCPNPKIWNKVYFHLTEFYKNNDHIDSPPPKPLILNGWIFSSDLEKKIRWEETIKWTHKYNCTQLIPDIKESDKYKVDIMSIMVENPY